MRRLSFRRPGFPSRFHPRARVVFGAGAAAALVAGGSALAILAGIGTPASPVPAPGTVSPAVTSPASSSAAAGALDATVAGGGTRPGSGGRPGNGTRPGSGGRVKRASGDSRATAVPRLVVPDVIAAVPGGVTVADVAKLRKIAPVRAVLPISGGRVAVNGRPVTVLGASAARLRPWTPPATAGSAGVWSAFAAGDLLTTSPVARAGGLRAGREYPVAAGVRTPVRFGGSALLGVAGVGGIVSDTQAKKLRLVRNFAVLINAPAADMIALTGQVRSALGAGSQVVRLVPVSTGTRLPVVTVASTSRPASYMQLYQESAARYCPALSWTVLASIGQIESGDGVNVGPSSAGALGPMQFEPSTWKIWGITAFGETGTPDIMDPFDAVPSAARMLCADGAAAGGQSLRQAIFDYNHATWYVDEVLTLANEYSTEFSR